MYLRPSRVPGKPGSKTTSSPREESTAGHDAAILCRQCHHPITTTTERITVDGAHSHTFANPEGIVFEIGCFRSAWGCGYVGPASNAFTWFSGYRWRIALCAGCRLHIGWRFSNDDGGAFHGLIANRLLFPLDRS